MNGKPVTAFKVGYTRREFNTIFQLYSRNVYTGLFRDFSFGEYDGRYFISFREEAGKTPLVSVEKRRLGPDRALFVASMPGPRGQPVEVARSEKIENFVEQLGARIERLLEERSSGPAAFVRAV